TTPPDPAPTTTMPPDPEPTLAPASSSSGLDSGSGVLIVGLGGVLVGSVVGSAAAFRLRRRRTE
ncbi:hypothetical protein, partial [Micromonospora sicca]|uniref:hypothetical protein n=1 Tax=Micromonospora sicca TaxID=2202420 RepID=UPI003F65B240